MYLLVIVTLIIGLLSIYAQVLSVQAARFAASQAGLAWTMATWHGGAVSMANKILAVHGSFPNNSTYGSPGVCSLTYSLPVGTMQHCPTPTGASGGTVTDSSNTPNTIGSGEAVHVPADYNFALYQFYSVLYYPTTTSTIAYVVTYVQAPTLSTSNPAPGFLSLPPTNRLSSLSMADLIHQMSVSGVPLYAYGTNVNGATSVVKTNYVENGVQADYVVPLTAGMDDGAIAIVSSLTSN